MSQMETAFAGLDIIMHVCQNQVECQIFTCMKIDYLFHLKQVTNASNVKSIKIAK